MVRAGGKEEKAAKIVEFCPSCRYNKYKESWY